MHRPLKLPARFLLVLLGTVLIAVGYDFGFAGKDGNRIPRHE